MSFAAAAATAPAMAQTPDKALPIHGTVVSTDRAHGTVLLRYSPPGSQPATRRTFDLANHNDVLILRVGAVIDGTADTSHRVWVLSNVNVESERPVQGQTTP